MRCEQIQELLLTDHLDGRLRRSEQEKLAVHLRNCTTCREFAGIAKATLLTPFLEAEQLTPPERVWQEVRQRIVAAPRRSCNPLRAFLGKLLLPLPVARQPALVCAGLVAVALLTAILMRPPYYGSGPSAVSHAKPIDYAAILTGEDEVDDEGEGLDTDIENYFL